MNLIVIRDAGAERAALMYTLIQTCLCRGRHNAVYAARRTMPKGAGNDRLLRRAGKLLGDAGPRSIRHSSDGQSASRKASKRSLGRKRVCLAPSYGLSLASAASLSARWACR